MEQSERIANAFSVYERALPAAQQRADHKAAVAAAAARVDLVLLLATGGYEPEPEVTAQVRRDIHLLYNGEGVSLAGGA